MTPRNRVLGVLALAVAAVTLYGWAVDSALTRTYLMITVVLTVVIAGLDRYVRFSEPVLWGLAAIAVGNMLGGVLLIDGDTLYLTSVLGPVRYDKVFHAIATGVGAVAAWQALRVWAGVERLTLGLAVAVVLMACGAGALVETVEYVGTLVIPNSNVGDYGNNMLDLIANLTGAVLAVALVALRAERPAHSAG